MHTTESKWQDEPLEVATALEWRAMDSVHAADMLRGAAMIRTLVFLLEQKIKDLDSLEPSE